MPTRFQGTIEQRFAYLDKIGRRCAANEGRCISTATDEFDVLPAEGGKPTGAPETIVITCGRHRPYVLASPKFVVKAHRKNALSGTSEMRRMVA